MKITQYRYSAIPESLTDLYDILKNDVATVASDRMEVLDIYKRLISPKYYTVGSIYGTPTLDFNFQTTEAEDFRLRTKLVWRDGEHHPRPKPLSIEMDPKDYGS